MGRCKFRLAAEEDLESIADYIAEDNPSRAVTFIQEIREKCRTLAEMPKSAPARSELGPAYSEPTGGKLRHLLSTSIRRSRDHPSTPRSPRCGSGYY